MAQATNSFETIKYEIQDNILTITLNRPDKMNAFTSAMRDEVIAAFDAADADDNVRAVIVTGAGRAFCAGADLSEGGKTFDRAARTDHKTAPLRPNGEVEWSDDAVRDGGGRVTLRIFKCLKPVIGAINGAAVGIGVTMQLPMDIRIASQDARFGFVFARRGIVPEAASSWFLPASSASRRPWRGAIRARCSRRRKHSKVASSAKSFRRMNCCPQHARSPGRSWITPRRFPLR